MIDLKKLAEELHSKLGNEFLKPYSRPSDAPHTISMFLNKKEIIAMFELALQKVRDETIEEISANLMEISGGIYETQFLENIISHIRSLKSKESKSDE